MLFLKIYFCSMTSTLNCVYLDCKGSYFQCVLFVVPGPVPVKSLQGTSFENKIFLNWKEPLEPNGIITQYEV